MNIHNRIARLEQLAGAACDHEDAGLVTRECTAADLLAGRVNEVSGDVPACSRCGLAPTGTIVTEVLVKNRGEVAALRRAELWA